MSSYSIHNRVQDTESHIFLIGTPLIVISFLCFGYMMIRSHNDQHLQPASNHTKPMPARQASSLPSSSFTQDSRLDPVSTGGASGSSVDSSSSSLPASSTDSGDQSASESQKNSQSSVKNGSNPSSSNKSLLKTIENLL